LGNRERREIIGKDGRTTTKTTSTLDLDLDLFLPSLLFVALSCERSPTLSQKKKKMQAKTTATCDDACQKHVKLAEGAILALTVGAALAAGAGFLHAIDTPTRFLGGALDKSGVGGGIGGGDGGVS
jgi:hypothetical protein